MTRRAPSLEEVFGERFYENLEGGILESFGRLFKNGLKLYVYPLKQGESGNLVTAGTSLEASSCSFDRESIHRDLRDFNESYLPIFPPDVLAKIRNGDSGWEDMVSPWSRT